MPKPIRILAALLLVAVAGACVETTRPNRTLADLLNQSTNHTTLRGALISAGLTGYVSGTEGPEQITLFAPTDAAWQALPDTTRAAILNDPARLRTVLLNQMVEGRVVASELEDGGVLTTLAGERVGVEGSGLTAQVGGASLVLANLDSFNGVLHVTDRVILPSAP